MWASTDKQSCADVCGAAGRVCKSGFGPAPPPTARKKFRALLAAKPQDGRAPLIVTEPASCGCDTWPEPESLRTCQSAGDPHFIPFYGKKYNFMALGTYRLAKTTIASCGCDLEVQAFMAPNKKWHGASSNVAVAMKAGELLFVIRADLSMHVSGGGYDETVKFSEYGDTTEKTFKMIKIKKAPNKGKGYFHTGLLIGIPGGGVLTVYTSPLTQMQEGVMMNLWLSLPDDAAKAVEDGLCAHKCKGLPPLPNTQCGTGHCVPVYDEDKLFSDATLGELQHIYLNDAQSTRPTKDDCADIDKKEEPPDEGGDNPPPPPVHCEDGACKPVPDVPVKIEDGSACVPKASDAGTWWDEGTAYHKCLNIGMRHDRFKKVKGKTSCPVPAGEQYGWCSVKQAAWTSTGPWGGVYNWAHGGGTWGRRRSVATRGTSKTPRSSGNRGRRAATTPTSSRVPQVRVKVQMPKG